jgi:uncharacterized protein (DUF885 family)
VSVPSAAVIYPFPYCLTSNQHTPISENVGITSLFGYHSYFAQAPGNMALDTQQDYERYLISLADFPRHNREHMALLREGIDTGYIHYCESMAGHELTISNLIVDDPRESSLYSSPKKWMA